MAPFDGVQIGAPKKVGHLAGHVEGDRQLWRGLLFGCGDVLRREVVEGGAYGAADDVVLAGQGGDGLAFEEGGAGGARVAPPRAGRRPHLSHSL
ncbi:hypothetical protein ACQRET_33195, partial [Streptomyces koyangensis]|uniref:hypothetical protein n=1 Tax=Streptomyces koyangensis TaxID=188770 RepID=UPI003D07C16D